MSCDEQADAVPQPDCGLRGIYDRRGSSGVAALSRVPALSDDEQRPVMAIAKDGGDIFERVACLRVRWIETQKELAINGLRHAA